ncbi:MAG: hypothetical protein V4613_02780 [Bacteroidota bacterium]
MQNQRKNISKQWIEKLAVLCFIVFNSIVLPRLIANFLDVIGLKSSSGIIKALMFLDQPFEIISLNFQRHFGLSFCFTIVAIMYSIDLFFAVRILRRMTVASYRKVIQSILIILCLLLAFNIIIYFLAAILSIGGPPNFNFELNT